MDISHKFGTLSFLTAMALVPLSVLLLCTGCSDEIESDLSDPDTPLQFEATVAWNNGQSRAANTPRFDDTVYVMDSETGGAPLYLHTRTEQNTSNPFNDSENTQSRGSLSNTVGGSFALYGGTFTDAWDETTNSVDYLYNIECSRTSRGYYTPTTRYYWPIRAKLKVFAYAPYNLLYYSVTDRSEVGSPKLTYAVTPIIKFQQDLLTASCIGDPDEDGFQDLTFRHALTAIRFAAADDMKEGHIKSISIKGVYSTATTIIGSNEWTDHYHPTDYTIEFADPMAVGTPETAGVIFTADPNIFIMMPQTPPDGAYLEIQFIDIVDIERTFTAKIDGMEWLPGTIITYYLSPELLYVFTDTDYIYKPMF